MSFDTLPDNLKSLVVTGLRALDSNRFQALPLPNRRAIWREMGPVVLDKNQLASGAGLARRLRLATLSVEAVIHVWETTFATEKGVARMIELSQSVLAGSVSPDIAKKECGDFQVRADDLGYETNQEVAALVGNAASRLVTIALYDMYFGEADTANANDEDLDPYLWDPSYLAAMVAAGGPFNAPGSNNQKRGDFWRWYLNEGVVSAVAES